MSDDLAALHERLQAQRNETGTNPETGDFSFPDGPMSNKLPEGPSGLTRSRDEFESDMDTIAGFSSIPMVLFTVKDGRAYKRHKNLSGEADADAERFLKTNSVPEQQYMMYVAIVENCDMLHALMLEKAKNYKIPDTLKKTAQDYGAVMILSPSVFAYRADGLTISVMDIMRELHITDIPAKSETGRCDMILTCIGKALIDTRCTVKTEIVKSLKDPAAKQDIATLTKACIGTTKAKPTAALYIRIAFLRAEAKKLLDGPSTTGIGGKKDDESFWKVIDNRLAAMRKRFVTPVDLQGAFEILYEDDKKLYGNPDSNSVIASRELDEWLNTLYARSTQVTASR